MKKKFTYFVAVVCAALTFSACSSDKLEAYSGQTLENPESPSNAISFGTYMGKTGTTRAAGKVVQNYSKGGLGNKDAEGITHLARAGFGVFSYFTGASDLAAWKTANPTAKNPNFMYNQKLEFYSADKDAATLDGYSGSGEYWTYEPVKYWPNGIDLDNVNTSSPNYSTTATQQQAGKLSFFAFAPYTAVSGAYEGSVPSDVSSYDNGVTVGNTKTTGKTNGVAAITANNSQSDVWVKYVMPNANANEAVDLLWGTNGKTTYQETDASDPSVGALGSAYNVNLTKQIVTEKVKFLFKHALAKVGGQTVSTEDLDQSDASCAFKVVVDVDKNSETPKTGGQENQATYFGSNFSNEKTLVTLKEVKIQDGKSAADDGLATSGTVSTLNNSGWFNIEQGIWKGAEVATAGASYNVVANNTNSDATDTEYTLNKDIREGTVTNTTGENWTTSNSGGATGVTLSPKPIFAKENVPALLLIPGSSTEIYVTVDYIVRTADANLSKGYSEVEQRITNKVSLGSLNPNKYYTIIMHLGLTSVKFEAVVADWSTKDADSYTSDGSVSPSGNVDTEVIWLPANVVNGTSASITPLTLTVANGTGSDNKIAKGGESVALTVKLSETSVTPTSVITNADWLSYSGGNLTATANSGTERSTTVYVTFTDSAGTHTGSVVVTQEAN